MNTVDPIGSSLMQYSNLVGGAVCGGAAPYLERLQGEIRSVHISFRDITFGFIVVRVSVPFVPAVIPFFDDGVIFAVAQSQIFHVARRGHFTEGVMYRFRVAQILAAVAET